jgi:hypothetical protein
LFFAGAKIGFYNGNLQLIQSRKFPTCCIYLLVFSKSLIFKAVNLTTRTKCKPSMIGYFFYYLLFIIAVIFSYSINAQDYHDFGFERNAGIRVFGSDQKILDLAWTGGLNAAQFHRFDLNFNGTEDLIIFDRHGNRLLTFLNDGSDSEYAFSFAPEYIGDFPPMHDWVQFIDFNNNGKKDIFTYTVGGIKVFKNISDTAIRFQQITFPYLLTQIGSIQTNLFVTDVDYPAILDMDGDGDLDILTFWVLTTFVEMHTNKSMELYGHSDSLIYKKTEYCWGYFAESDESNQIYLDTCVNFKEMDFVRRKFSPEETRHAGSTLMMLDMTGNGLYDLILGDTDYPTLFLLKNEGTTDSAYIVDFDTLFPSNTRPVDLYSMPAAFSIDINNNGINDLVVSPFEKSLRRSKHHNSVWFYKNIGSNEFPEFMFEREDLFQHRMIDVGAGALPVLADLDNDGLPDLIIGNFGYNDTCFFDQFLNLSCKYIARLAYFKNTGSLNNPEFTLVDDDFANLAELGLRAVYPAFGDLDGDGKAEMMIGNANGNLLLYKNISKNSREPEYELVDDNFQQIAVSAFSAPQLIDLNGNGLPDLVLGQENGKISYYENQGSATNPVFVKITDELGGVNVTDPMFSYTGHSIPHFFHDAQETLRLFVGSESGRIHYYSNIDGNLDGAFTLVEERLLQINEGIRTAPAVGFLTGSNYPDLIVGNYGGGLGFYEGIAPQPFGIENPQRITGIHFDIFPNPASSQLTLVMHDSGHENTGLEVFDLTGRLVFEIRSLKSSQTTIPVHDWKHGFYIFSLRKTGKGGSFLEGRKMVVVGMR